MNHSKPMLGGCSVCMIEIGWDNNPLVYCDGKSCTVAVHQACYGIVLVPEESWFCKSCEAGNLTKTVKCCLCPYKGGALKTTGNKNEWAHVVCALYIPEVEFKNVETMEPILTNKVPEERYEQCCKICEEHDDSSYSKKGACVKCSKSGCKVNFHVTCAQIKGLLCERTGGSNTTKYCGYCEQHISKSKKRVALSEESRQRLYYPALAEETSDVLPTKETMRQPLPQRKSSAGEADSGLKENSEAAKAQLHTIKLEVGEETSTKNTKSTDEVKAKCIVPAAPQTPSKNLAGASATSSEAFQEVSSTVKPAEAAVKESGETVKTGASNKTSRKKSSSKGATKAKPYDRSKNVKKNSTKASKSVKSKPKPDSRASKGSTNDVPTNSKSKKKRTKSNDMNKVEFAQAPKHSCIKLANFGEESMQASEPDIAGTLKPTASTQSRQVDIYGVVESMFNKQKEEYYEFLLKDMNADESDLLKKLLQLEKEKKKQEVFIAQLERRKKQFLLVYASLGIPPPTNANHSG